MLHAQLDQFKNNIGTNSEEQGGHFQQDVMDFERRYQVQFNENIMEDYIWGFLRESLYKYKKITKNIHFFNLIFYYFYICMLLLIIIFELKRLLCSAKLFLIEIKL